MLAVATLKRSYKADRTEGVFILPSGDTVFTLERPWKDNATNVSCIPPGAYLAKWLERSGSGRYKRVWHVQDVPGRTGILWHQGNLVRHTYGCILPGTKFGKLEGKPAVLSSAIALGKIRDEFANKDFILVVQ